jgi:serine/threonine-protein kinase
VDRIGNYRIDGERRRDETSVVYEGRHLVLPRRAFIKVMHASVKDAAVQLLREACILEALEHPGIVRVFESGLLADKRPWFAYERVEGATVADLIVNGLEPINAATLVRDVADILDHAHRRGVVHSALRPDRIVVTGRTRGFPICIADWSDARIHDTSAPTQAQGPVDYTAPEVINGEALDDRADVFSLGVIAYQALTGELPFDGVWLATVADGETNHVPAQVRCPTAPSRLCELIDQMLAWDRRDRPSSAETHGELVLIVADMLRAGGRGTTVRIRKPRWTPALTFENEPDIVAEEVPEEPAGPTKSS